MLTDAYTRYMHDGGAPCIPFRTSKYCKAGWPDAQQEQSSKTSISLCLKCLEQTLFCLRKSELVFRATLLQSFIKAFTCSSRHLTTTDSSARELFPTEQPMSPTQKGLVVLLWADTRSLTAATRSGCAACRRTRLQSSTILAENSQISMLPDLVGPCLSIAVLAVVCVHF